LLEDGRAGNIGSIATCLGDLIRGEDSDEAAAALLTLADALNEIRLLRQALSKVV
jgi:hypothetical protein